MATILFYVSRNQLYRKAEELTSGDGCSYIVFERKPIILIHLLEGVDRGNEVAQSDGPTENPHIEVCTVGQRCLHDALHCCIDVTVMVWIQFPCRVKAKSVRPRAPLSTLLPFAIKIRVSETQWET